MRDNLIKLVIWDLDDTLWRGTLAEGDTVQLLEHRAALVRNLNDHGVLSSICSKNDPHLARDRLIELGMWDQFVFPRIAFEPKSKAIAQIIEDMQLRPANVLFIDDNPINLHEARFALPGLHIIDVRNGDSDAQIEAILVNQPAGRNRIEDYRRLERKAEDRRAVPVSSDEEFLRSCEIRGCAVAMMANLDFRDRIVELTERSNQLNYTQSVWMACPCPVR